jgi:hypothetical protein
VMVPVVGSANPSLANAGGYIPVTSIDTLNTLQPSPPSSSLPSAPLPTIHAQEVLWPQSFDFTHIHKEDG